MGDAGGGVPDPALFRNGRRGAPRKGHPGPVLSSPVVAHGGPRPVSGGQRRADGGIAAKPVDLSGRAGGRLCVDKCRRKARCARKPANKRTPYSTHTNKETIHDRTHASTHTSLQA